MDFDFTELFYRPDIEGWVSRHECEWLFAVAMKCSSVVEIGCWKGRATYALLMGCRNGFVYAVDTFRGTPSELSDKHKEALETDIYEVFMRNVGHFPNLQVIRGESLSIVNLFEDKSVDMVFIDGDHSKFALDFEAWFPKCGKLICGHDADDYYVSTYFNQNNINVNRGYGSIWYLEV